MFTVLNIVIIALVLLIAYWWANQGVFSALLHLVSVIIAGAIAFGFWETLTHLVLRGSAFDNFAWGTMLIGTFAVALFAVRILFDKLAPNNVALPTWSNLAFGAPLGIAAGVLTMGILIIGCGHIQSTIEIMNFRGTARNERNGQVEQLQTLWVPVHSWTAGFYSQLSVTSFKTSTPMRHYAPELDVQATSLMRDSAKKGRAALALAPEAAEVKQWNFAPGDDLVGVTVDFMSAARDFGEQLTVSCAQVRLVESVKGTKKPRVLHPTRWFQDGQGYLFDNHQYYMTSASGRDSATATFVFNVPSGFTPRFIQLKGTRYMLREGARSDDPVTALASVEQGGSADLFGGKDISGDIEITDRIRPIRANRNQLPGAVRQSEGYITGTGGERVNFPRSGFASVGRDVQIFGLYETLGSRIVQLDVSRASRAWFFDTDLLQGIPDGARLQLVDERGFQYRCIGYLHEHDEGTALCMDAKNYVDTLEQIPQLPSTGDQKMRLLFQVTEDVSVVGFTFGDKTIGRCNLFITPAEV